MNIDEFRESLIRLLNERFPDRTFSEQYVSKLNGQSYTGITGRKEAEEMVPVVDIRPLFDSYENGMPIEKAADELEKVFRSAMEQSQFIDPKDLTDYTKMKDRLILQLIPIEGNEERLNEIPHEQISDFAVICRVELADGEASTIVTDQLMKSFDISKEQLFADVKENAPRLHPPVLKNLMEVLFQAEPGLMDMESPLHVATTDVGEHGACVMAYPGFMDQASETLGGSFFVIPSSVHELLFLRDDDGRSVKELDDMVQAVNAQEVQPSDRLSDVSYHYDAETKTLERSAEWEERRDREAELSVQPDEHLEETTGLATMTVLLVNAEEYPKEIEIATGLESLQQAVQGNIEIVYPFDDPVGIICNEEGKLNGMKLNRALKNDQGEIQDILTGPFLVVGLGDEDFRSLTPDEMKKYEGIFHQPEAFVRMGKGIKSVPIPDEVLKADRTQEPKSKSQEHGAL